MERIEYVEPTSLRKGVLWIRRPLALDGIRLARLRPYEVNLFTGEIVEAGVPSFDGGRVF